ncbi:MULTISPECIES: VOC family protein [unclassified Nonomuraea]|uniref:VOC family protein n=1 Tax=unclassified Nonomuraea TaxID=2593643 RepID=UPI0033C0D954
MPLAGIAVINLECPDPISLARFWAHMLSGEITVETPGFCAVKVGTLHLGAVRVEDDQPPTWQSNDRSQQIHLDLTVDDLDTAEHEAVRSSTHAPHRRRTRPPSPEVSVSAAWLLGTHAHLGARLAAHPIKL